MNVLASGLLTAHGACAFIVQCIQDAQLPLLFDDRIIDEYSEVLNRPHFGFEEAQIEDFMAAIRANGEEVVALPLKMDIPDADDLMFIEVAKTAGATIVSGNTKHFPGIKEVMTTSELLEDLEE